MADNKDVKTANAAPVAPFENNSPEKSAQPITEKEQFSDPAKAPDPVEKDMIERLISSYSEDTQKSERMGLITRTIWTPNFGHIMPKKPR